VETLIDAAKSNRYGHRDATMLLVAYRHGLRASELCGLEWSQVDFYGATLHVRRVKNTKAATHLIRGDEMRALRKLQREAPKSTFVFVNERGTPFSPDSFNWLVKRTGQDNKEARAPSSLQNIRLNSDVANLLSRSQNWRADGDGCVLALLNRAQMDH
jgi:integrase